MESYAHRSPSIVPISSPLNPVHALPTYAFKIRFNIILQSTPMFSSGLFLHESPACINTPKLHIPLNCKRTAVDMTYKRWYMNKINLGLRTKYAGLLLINSDNHGLVTSVRYVRWVEKWPISSFRQTARICD